MRVGVRRVARSLTASMLSVAALVACVPEIPPRIGGPEPAVAGVTLPPMGWNSARVFGCDVDEDAVLTQADALVDSGLAAAGYTTVVLGACWAAPDRDASGRLRFDPDRFPSGPDWLDERLRERGLTLGLSTITTESGHDSRCEQEPAPSSRDHETLDAQTLADWGVGLVYQRWCGAPDSGEPQTQAFLAMRDGVRRTGVPIAFGIVGSAGSAVNTDWGGVATMTGLTPVAPDRIAPDQVATESVIDTAGALAHRVAPGALNDPGVLPVGSSMTTAQQRTAVSMWAMMAAPMMIGADLVELPDPVRALLSEPAVIALDQDARVSAGAPVDDDPEVWARAVGERGLVVSMTNRSGTARDLSVDMDGLGLVGEESLAGRDMWTGLHHRPYRGELTVRVAPGDTALLEIVGAPAEEL